MAQRADLEAAAAAGVISPEQAAALEAFLQTRSAPIGAIALPGPANGEEDLRFIRNFHDVFLSIGIVIFAAGTTVAGFTLPERCRGVFFRCRHHRMAICGHVCGLRRSAMGAGRGFCKAPPLVFAIHCVVSDVCGFRDVCKQRGAW